VRQKLSVIIIMKNEASNLRRCLESVIWADEIIVVDSGSTDGSLEIARQFTPLVYEMDWAGYGKQKNRALEKATNPWVLSLDADEVIPPQLATEITQILANGPAADGYAIQRLSLFCGKWIRYGDWHSDWVVRLWRRQRGKFEDKMVHEKLIVEGQIKKMNHPIHHYTYPNLHTALQKMNTYSTIWAQQAFSQGKRTSLWQAILHAKWGFFRGYIFRRGFQDGWQGFVLAVTNAIGTFYKYVKLKAQQEHD
jgi:glycosyltransferase involved in cell wall biosynthesis